MPPCVAATMFSLQRFFALSPSPLFPFSLISALLLFRLLRLALSQEPALLLLMGFCPTRVARLLVLSQFMSYNLKWKRKRRFFIIIEK